MILDKIQLTLDTLLYPDVFSYWNKFKEIQGKVQSEYVVYTLSDSPTEMMADDKPLVRMTGVTVKYYYDSNIETTRAGRTSVYNRANGILIAMEGAGFESITGTMFMGDLDDIGYNVVVMDFVFHEVQ